MKAIRSGFWIVDGLLAIVALLHVAGILDFSPTSSMDTLGFMAVAVVIGVCLLLTREYGVS
jgi:hypothetical protein